MNGYRVLYQTSAQLLADLTASLADKTLPARLRRYASPDLVIIDEFGFDKIERIECPEAAHLLYKIIASRNQKRSTALVTNVDFDKWGDYLSDGPLAMAFLDRLVEGAIILKLKGRSYRAEKAKTSENRPSAWIAARDRSNATKPASLGGCPLHYGGRRREPVARDARQRTHALRSPQRRLTHVSSRCV